MFWGEFTNKDPSIIGAKRFTGRQDAREMDGGMRLVEEVAGEGLRREGAKGWGHISGSFSSVSSWFL